MSGTTNVPSVCVVLRRGEKVLFLLRENTGFNDGQYAVPSGHVEREETFLQAACREANEEVGVRILPEHMKHAATIHRKARDDVRVDVWFEASTWTGEPMNNEPEKHSKIEWLSINKLPDNIVDYIKLGLETMAGQGTYNEIGWSE